MKTSEQIDSKIVDIRCVAFWFRLWVFAALVVPHTVRAAPTTGVSVPGGAAHWICPKPPYPEEARLRRQAGIIYVRITTDSTGVVTKVDASVPARQKQDVSILGVFSVRWVLARWHGPPNIQKKKVEFEYRLRTNF